MRSTRVISGAIAEMYLSSGLWALYLLLFSAQKLAWKFQTRSAFKSDKYLYILASDPALQAQEKWTIETWPPRHWNEAGIGERAGDALLFVFVLPPISSHAEFLALKNESRILGHSSNPVSGFSMMKQVRLCAVWPMESWLGSSLNHIQGWTTVRESYSCFTARTSVLTVTSSGKHLIFLGFPQMKG